MQELRQEADDRRKSKPVVGSIKSSAINYPQSLPMFNQSHIPAHAQSIKASIKSSVFPDILGRNKPSWNTSVLLDRSRKYEEQVHLNQLHFEIRQGLRDYSLPPTSPNKIYEGVDTRNSFAGWNVSVEVSPQDYRKTHQSIHKKARYNSSVKNREMLEGKPYIKPFDRQVHVLNQSRTTKQEDSLVKSEKLKQVLHENPDISNEKATAMVHRLVQELKEKNSQDELYGVKSESFCPDLSKTLKQKIKKQYRHDGVYHFNENLEKKIWSCCMKESEESPGCVCVKKDYKKWQLISF